MRELIAGGESMSVEFKRGASVGHLNDRELVEAVACLANAEGGTLLIGVEDDGRVTGCAPRHGEVTDPARVEALVIHQTVPPLSVECEVHVVDGSEVVVVAVPSAAGVVGTAAGRFQRRGLRLDGKPECRAMSPAEILSSTYSFGTLDFATTVASGARFDDLDPDAFDRYRSSVATSRGDAVLAGLPDAELLQSLALGFPQPDGTWRITFGAILLFGTAHAIRRYVPNHEVLIQVLDGTELRVNESVVAPLLECAQRAYERMQASLTEDEVQWGLIRVKLPLVPADALREAIANALVHRDFTARGPVRITLTKELLTVSSPGGLPPGMSLANLVDQSMPRSPMLADALKRAGLVERSGRGVARMIEAALRVGRSEPSFARTTDAMVVADFPLGRADLDLVRFLLGDEGRPGPPLSLTALRIVAEVRSVGSATVGEISGAIGVPGASLRPTLTSLVESGVLELRGAGRGRRYHLASAFYRHSEQRAAYIRVRGTDPMQQEQMVVRWIEEYGSISRGEAADLCLITGQQATTLLQRLRDEGRIEMTGERRTARYVLVGGDPG